MASSNLRYIVFENADLTKMSQGASVSGRVFSSEEEAIAHANKSTVAGYQSTIGLATKLVKPKPVEMVTVDIASC